MDYSSEPGVSRSQVGAELRKLRERHGNRIADVSARLEWSPSKLSRIETGQSGVRATDVALLLDLYEVEADDRVRLSEMAAGAGKTRSWIDGYTKVLPETYGEYFRLEAEAVASFSYDVATINSLLQTAEYATALVKATIPASEPDAIPARVAAQMARQVVLTREPPMSVVVMLDESALRRTVGGTGVRHRQLLRLLELTAQPTISVRVVPITAGAHGGVLGSFSILDFEADGGDSSVVFCDGLTGGRLLRNADERQAYRTAARQVAGLSLDEKQSLRLIGDVVKSLAP